MRPTGFVLLTILFISSCRKPEVFTNSGLNGKWKLKEIFSGYTMGGNFQWSPVPESNSHLLAFYSGGRYEVIPLSGLTTSYRGNFVLINDSTLARTFSNQADAARFYEQRIRLSPTQLIIDYPNIEGVVRYKYRATEN